MKADKRTGLLVLGIILVVIDQVIKVLVKTNLPLGGGFNVLGNWFRILFVENEGMAFGMSFGGVAGKYVLTFFRLVLFVVLLVWIGRLCRRKDVPKGVLIGLTMITAGALGNIIDCLFYGLIFSESGWAEVASFGGHYAPLLQGKVVDMFYFPLFTWPDWVPWLGGHIFFEPIFNFADSCVTVGAFYLILFQYRFFSKDAGSDKDSDKSSGSKGA